MTALDRYDRLEASGLWHRPEGAREVLVTFGEARLTLSTFEEEPLAQWSIAALAERESDGSTARFSPDPDFAEWLDLSDPDMIAALRAVIAPPRRRPWRALANIAYGALAVAALTALAWPRIETLLHGEVTPAEIAAFGTRIMETNEAMAICTAEDVPAVALLEERIELAEGTLIFATYPTERTQVIRLPDGRLVIDERILGQAPDADGLAGLIVDLDMRHPTELYRARAVDRLTDPIFGLGGFMADEPGFESWERVDYRERGDEARITPESEAALADRLAELELPTRAFAELLVAIDQDKRAEAIAALDRIGADAYPPALLDVEWLRLRAQCLSDQ
ncbi:MAG: hypothetical protein ACPGID_04430 [Rubricella sp.]